MGVILKLTNSSDHIVWARFHKEVVAIIRKFCSYMYGVDLFRIYIDL